MHAARLELSLLLQHRCCRTHAPSEHPAASYPADHTRLAGLAATTASLLTAIALLRYGMLRPVIAVGKLQLLTAARILQQLNSCHSAGPSPYECSSCSRC
jgi:hypothetical protein